MSQISSKLRSLENGGLMYWCQGCESTHVIYTGEGNGPRWGYNGNPEKPTFTPSVLIRSGHYASNAQLMPDGRCGFCVEAEEDGHKSYCGVCHTFITDGMVQFLGDCTHQYAGQTLPLPELPAHLQDRGEGTEV